MSNDENTVHSCHSLIQLLGNYEVHIPIIQRDYAQGRNNEKAKTVRKRLIEDFITYLEDNEKSLDFNFIYGNTESDKDRVFYPVDGQQRLTSLYLLHWVLACRSGKINEFNELKAFSYATRNSANEFFQLLKNPRKELIDLAKGTRFMRKIKNYWWFAAEWDNDPTVISALIFIDDLCTALENRKDYEMLYERLSSENSAVYFKMLEENSGVNAEMAAAVKYIRMNARGKELTTFENIKAMIDSIREKFKIDPDIINLYDVTHIDVFYEISSKETADILRKNCLLDEKSLWFFKNIYNIVNLVECCQPSLSTLEYMNQMYEESQKKEIDTEFFNFYFQTLNLVLAACKNSVVRDRLMQVFSQEFTTTANKLDVAYVLYIYHLNIDVENESGINGLEDKLNKLQYILDNLLFTSWKETNYNVANKLLKDVAGSSDAFSYFAENVFDVKGEELCNDINVRLKEQHIKSKIIKDNQKDYKYFEELEKRDHFRKIQYLLWISDLWTDNDADISTEKAQTLFKYKKIATTYFMKNNLNWNKRFSVAGCTDNSRLLTCDLINKIDWRAKCEWNDMYYFWDDKTKPNLHKLNILKIAYDNEASLYSSYKSLLVDRAYENCWLRYAVLRDYNDLLLNPISYNQSTNRVYITFNDIRNPKTRDFISQVLLLDLVGKVHESRLPLDLISYDLSSQRCYGKFNFITNISETWKFSANTLYKHSADKNLIFGKEWRNYNLTLQGISYINVDSPLEEGIVSAYDKNNKELRLYIPDIGNTFTVFRYDMSAIVDAVTSKSKSYRNEFYNMTRDRMLEIYHHRTGWSHDGGNTHSWKKTESYSVVSNGRLKHVLS